MKKYVKWLLQNKLWSSFIIGILVLFIVPGIVYGLSVPAVFPTDNDWTGFWGGYLGSIIGGLITLYVMHKSLIENRKDLAEQIKNEKVYFEKRYEYDKTLMINQIIMKSCDDILERTMLFCTLVTKCTLSSQRFLESSLKNFKKNITEYENNQEIIDNLQINAIEHKNMLNAEFITISTLLGCREYEKREELYVVLETIKRKLEVCNVGQYESSLENYSSKESIEGEMKKRLNDMKNSLNDIQRNLNDLNIKLADFYEINIRNLTS